MTLRSNLALRERSHRAMTEGFSGADDSFDLLSFSLSRSLLSFLLSLSAVLLSPSFLLSEPSFFPSICSTSASSFFFASSNSFVLEESSAPVSLLVPSLSSFSFSFSLSAEASSDSDSLVFFSFSSLSFSFLKRSFSSFTLRRVSSSAFRFATTSWNFSNVCSMVGTIFQTSGINTTVTSSWRGVSLSLMVSEGLEYRISKNLRQVAH
mmetsp:Transcript_24431/g.40152  ORF Transcript_24431/g.40152 Transcript_24431/m.40152 type:complete len:208 (-) Transcript_24431:1485-2108(-)